MNLNFFNGLSPKGFRVLPPLEPTRDTHTPPYFGPVCMEKSCAFLDFSSRFTLSTSGPAIAALVCAFYPRFPISSTDNR